MFSSIYQNYCFHYKQVIDLKQRSRFLLQVCFVPLNNFYAFTAKLACIVDSCERLYLQNRNVTIAKFCVLETILFCILGVPANDTKNYCENQNCQIQNYKVASTRKYAIDTILWCLGLVYLL
jgi:hypothetical protein